MEFPSLGGQCAYEQCKQLDFLPMNCDACKSTFCKDHIHYASHNCASGSRKDVQIPVCPLCFKPIPPASRGDPPDLAVGAHIDSDCQSDPAKAKRKIYTNKCFVAKCKQKELVPIRCDSCRQNFCLKHRHPADHSCKGFQGTGRPITNAGAAAVQRISAAKSAVKSSSAKSTAAHLQAGMSESEALKLAMQMSLADTGSSSGGATAAANRDAQKAQEEADMALAHAIAESEAEFAQRPPTTPSKSSDKCVLS